MERQLRFQTGVLVRARVKDKWETVDIADPDAGSGHTAMGSVDIEKLQHLVVTLLGAVRVANAEAFPYQQAENLPDLYLKDRAAYWKDRAADWKNRVRMVESEIALLTASVQAVLDNARDVNARLQAMRERAGC